MSKQDVIEQLEAGRQSLVKIAKRNILIGIGVSGAGIILCLISVFANFSPDTTETLFFISILAIFAGITTIFGSITSLGSKYKKTIKDKISGAVLNQVFGEGKYVFNQQQGIEFNRLAESGCLRIPDRYISSGYFSSKKDDVSIEGANYIFTTITTYKDSEGHTRRVEHNYPGRAYVFEFPRNFNNFLAVYEKSFEGEVFNTPNRRSQVEFESVDFNKKFKAFTNDEKFAFYIMTPQVQLSIVDFDNKFSSNMIFAISGNKVFVFLANYSSKAKFGLFKKLDEASINQYIEELQMPIKLIDGIDLDKKKFLDPSLRSDL